MSEKFENDNFNSRDKILIISFTKNKGWIFFMLLKLIDALIGIFFISEIFFSYENY